LDRFDEPLGEALLRRKVVGGFVAAVLLMTLTGFCSWHSAQRAEEDSDWVTHTHAVLMNLEAAMRHLVNVETGGRGFALSGHEPFLEPYETGRRALAQDLDELRHLTADNPHQ
jgi:CHASE3 domain sensor protein